MGMFFYIITQVVITNVDIDFSKEIRMAGHNFLDLSFPSQHQAISASTWGGPGYISMDQKGPVQRRPHAVCLNFMTPGVTTGMPPTKPVCCR